MTLVQEITFDYYRSGMQLDEYCMVQEYAYPNIIKAQLLKEGIADVLEDLVQAGLGAGAITLTGGMAGDTAVDVVFAIKSASEVIDDVNGIISAGGQAGEILSDLGKINASAGMDGIYSTSKNIIDKAVATTSSIGMDDGISDFLNTIRDTITDLLDSLVKTLSKWIATLIPDDAGIGGIAIRETLQQAIRVVSGSVYSGLQTAIGTLPATAQDLLFDEMALSNFLTSILDTIVAYIDSLAEEPLLKKALKTGAKNFALNLIPVVGPVLATGNTVATIASELDSVRDFLDTEIRSMIPTAVMAFNKTVGLVFSFLAALQIIVKGEFEGARFDTSDIAMKGIDKIAGTEDAADDAFPSILTVPDISQGGEVAIAENKRYSLVEQFNFEEMLKEERMPMERWIHLAGVKDPEY